MNKLEKLVPERISVLNHKIVVSEKVFDSIVTTLNKHTEVINDLIDCINNDRSKISSIEESVKELRNATKRLAEALQTYTED